MDSRHPHHPTYDGRTYYDQPALKPSPWNWTVSTYTFLSGLSGAAEGLGLLVRHVDQHAYRGAVRNAHMVSVAGSAVGAALLIADLRTPQRWYNMLRIFRSTSPMSFGTYILSAFGAFSGVAGLAELAGRRNPPVRGARLAADTAQVGAAVTGAGAATYTAAVLSATSTPLWAATPGCLGAKFAASSIAAAAAALSIGERLGGRHETSRRLDDVAALATAAHVCVSVATHMRRRTTGVGEEMAGSREMRALNIADFVVAGALPLAAYGLNRFTEARSPGLSIAGSMAVLAGGALVRHLTMKAGMESARRPRAQFAFAQPRNLPDGSFSSRSAP